MSSMISGYGKLGRVILSSVAAQRTYRWLAVYYDRFFDGFATRAAALREQILGSLLPDVKSACDIACGTGTTALLLAGRGLRTVGVDLSPIMCRQARAKARAAGVRVRIIQGDMRDF